MIPYILFLLSCLTYLLWRKRQSAINKCDFMKSDCQLTVPKGPLGLPLIGNMLQLGERPYEKMLFWSKKFGPIYKLHLGSQLIVVLNGTDVIREALIENSEEFAGRPKLYLIHTTLKGKGVVSSPYNEDFNEHKRFLLNSFNRFGRRRSSLEVNCIQTIRETLNDYRERIDHNFEYTSVCMKNTLNQIASQNVLTMTFGCRMHDKKLFSTLMDLITENFRNTGIAAAFNFIPAMRIFKKYIFKNVMRCSDFLNTLISEKLQEFDEKNEYDEYSESNIIECYLKELMNNVCFFSTNMSTAQLHSSSSCNSFALQSRRLTERRKSSMTMSNYEELLKSKSRYKSFSFDHLSSLVQDLFVAGTETISVTLNWAIIYAAYFFDCQVKLCNEIDSILGREKLPTESDRTKLPYVEAFLNETMRFHCAGPILIPRSTTCDLNFRGYEIPKDTFIMVNMWSAMRDEVYWEDPEKFDPKRFIDEKGQFVCKNPAMMPFSVGKRSCIGESIARLQLFLIFTSLLQKFNFYIQSEKEFREKKLILGKPGLGLNPPNVSLKLKLR